MIIDPIWLVLIAFLIGVAFWGQLAMLLDAPSRMRRSVLLSQEEKLKEEYPDFTYAPLSPANIDFLGSAIARFGRDRECRGYFELSENGVRGVATDCKFRFRFGKHSPILLQTVLEIKFPGEAMPFFRAHPKSDLAPLLMEFDSVQTKTILDVTHQCECLDPHQIASLFDHSDPVASELAWLNTVQCSIECDRDRVLIYQLRHLVPPQKLPEFIRSGIRLATKLFMLEQQRQWFAQHSTDGKTTVSVASDV